MRVCARCFDEKPDEEFRVLRQVKRGRTYHNRASYCAECTKAYAREHHLLTKFGITPAVYQSMLDGQDNRCKLCAVTFDGIQPNIDHDHNTGKIRGLLCSFCNRGLGLFKDNAELLMKAVDYVKRKYG